MLRTFAVALLAIAMSVGLAQAKVHKHMPGCIMGQPATATCLCGVSFTFTRQPVLCQKGQWCHWQWRICTP